MRTPGVLCILLFASAVPVSAAEYSLPERVSVKPVAFVPKGEQPPTDEPSAGPGITYDNTTMWHSKPLADGSADLQITFPIRVRLSGLAIHSQHSGVDHNATAMRLEARDDGKLLIAAEQPLKSVDELVRFEPVESKQWSLRLQAGTSRTLVIRGLRFFDGDEEVLPWMVPFVAQKTSDDKPLDKSNAQFAYQAAAKKLPAPTAAQLETAKKAVKEQFKSEYVKAKKPEQKGTLARTLLENAEKAGNPAMTFALLNEAANNAAQAGQLDLALIAIKGLDDRFFVDILPLKITALAAAPPAKTAEEATLLLAKYKDLATAASFAATFFDAQVRCAAISRATEAAALASASPWKFGCSRDRPACAARFGGIRISNSVRYEDNFTPKKSFAKDSSTLFPP